MGFLAGGVAFNILLAGVPFVLMLAAALGYLLGESPDAATRIAQGVLERVLPAGLGGGGAMLDPVLADVQRTRAVFGIGGTILFFWFSARLFGSLRSVMGIVFNHDRDRTVFHGLLWDLSLSGFTVVLMVVWVGLTSFLTFGSGRIGRALIDVGVRQDLLGGAELLLGRLLALAVVVLLFALLYHWLPKRKTPLVPTIAGAVTATLLFEIARVVFGKVVSAYPPTSVYSGTLGALIVVVFWTYYAALIFVVGAEVAAATQQQLKARAEESHALPIAD